MERDSDSDNKSFYELDEIKIANDWKVFFFFSHS